MGHHDHHFDANSQETHNQKGSNHLKKQRQRTTAIALSILIVVSCGVIGFEVFSNQQANTENPTVRGSKSLLILSKEKENDGAGLIASVTPSRSNNNGSELDALTETNRLQAAKIKALKRQLVDANQKLHEVKGHLFTKGDPSDRSRLAEICQDLVEKDRESCEYKERVDQLEKEKQEALLKINRMEHTIDALAAMTDAQRSTKEQAVLDFQDQLDQLQNLAKEERDELLKSIENLDQIHLELRGSLAEKLSEIKNLEKEIGWQYNLLTEKDQEIQSLTQLYSSTESTMNKQLQDLVVAMELENLKNHNLTAEVDVHTVRHIAQLKYSKSLEDRIVQADEKAKQVYGQFQNNTLALIKEYLDFQGLLDVYVDVQTQLSNGNKKLAAIANEEKNKASKLHNDLADALAKNDAEQQRSLCLEQEMNQTVKELVTLKEKINTQTSLLDNKQKEVDILALSHTSLRDQLEKRIAQLTDNLSQEQLNIADRDELIKDLTINLELEKTRTQELNHMLKSSLVESREEQGKNSELEEELTQKTSIIASLENRIQDKQTEIADLSKQINTLSSDFSEEQLRTQELHRALVTALKENENDLLKIRELSQNLDGHTDTVALLQDRLAQKNNTLDQLQDKLSKIEDELEEEKTVNEELQRNLSVALAHKETEQERNQSLENDVQTSAKKLLFLQDSLSDKHQEIRTLLDQIQALNSDLDQERTRSKSLQENLESAIAKHEKEYRTARGMEASMQDYENHIHNLLSQMDDMATKIENEQKRGRNLEESLVSSLSKHDETLGRSKDLEDSLKNSDQKINTLHATLDEKEQILERLQQQLHDFNKDLEIEHNRNLTLQQSSEQEATQRMELERSLGRAQNTIEELQSELSSKENDNQALQNKILALASELDQEISRSVQLHTNLESGASDSAALKQQAQKLEKQLYDLSELIKAKEESLLKETQNHEETIRENSVLEQTIGLLQQDKDNLEQKYLNQLTLVLRQQELVNQLSNELASQKQKANQLEQESHAAVENKKQPEITHSIGAPNYHCVQEGESLTSISAQYYGTPDRWYDIYKANEDQIGESNYLESGMQLRIPD